MGVASLPENTSGVLLPVLFTPSAPLVPWPARGRGRDLWYHMRPLSLGLTLIKVNGTWVETTYPDEETLRPLTEGVDYFLGGRVYTVGYELAQELRDLGYRVEDWAFGDGAYGSGIYGDNLYGA